MVHVTLLVLIDVGALVEGLATLGTCIQPLG
jgi:hypothetical protein